MALCTNCHSKGDHCLVSYVEVRDRDDKSDPIKVTPRVYSNKLNWISFIALVIQWNPDFSNLDFSNLPVFRTMTRFPWFCSSQTLYFYPPIFRTLDFPKLLIFRTNRSCLPWRKFIRNLQLNLPSISRTCRKGLPSSFHLNGHTLGFYSQTQKLDPPFTYTENSAKEGTAQCFSFKGHFLAWLII